MLLFDSIKYEDLPSYELGLEKGIEDAIMMVKDFNLDINQVSQKLNLPIELIKNNLNKKEYL